MKYNPKINEKLAAAEELQAHPYAPHDLVQGNLEIMARLEEWLVELTGLAGFTPGPGRRRSRRIHRHAGRAQVPAGDGRSRARSC